MVSVTRDETLRYNLNNVNSITLDVSDYDYVIAHFIGVTGTIVFNGTIDGGGITGQTNDSPGAATNWINIQGTNQATGSAASSTSTGSMYKFSVVSRFLQFKGTANITKLLVYYAKIS